MSTSGAGNVQPQLPGGRPTTLPDIPVCVVFLVFYAVGAAGNAAMFKRYGKRLKWQMALFGYCMSRVTTLILRMAWSQHLTNRNLAIASSVFLNAGVLPIFLINLQMTKKIIFRTHHTFFVENPHKKALVKKVFAAGSFLLIPFLVLTITGAVQGLLARDPEIQRIDNILKHIGITTFVVYSLLPIPLLAPNAFVRYKNGEPALTHVEEKVAPGIGVRSWQSNRTVWLNSLIVLVSSLLVGFEYIIKALQSYANPRVPHWYFSKAAFYSTALLPDLLAMFILLLSNMPERYSGLALMTLEHRVEDNLEADAVTAVNSKEPMQAKKI